MTEPSMWPGMEGCNFFSIQEFLPCIFVEMSSSVVSCIVFMSDNERSISNSWVHLPVSSLCEYSLPPLTADSACTHHSHCILESPWHLDGLVQGCIMIHGQDLDSSPESDFWLSALAIICWHSLLILLNHKFAGVTSLKSEINSYNSFCLHSLYFGSIALGGGLGESQTLLSMPGRLIHC